MSCYLYQLLSRRVHVPSETPLYYKHYLKKISESSNLKFAMEEITKLFIILMLVKTVEGRTGM